MLWIKTKTFQILYWFSDSMFLKYITSYFSKKLQPSFIAISVSSIPSADISAPYCGKYICSRWDLSKLSYYQIEVLPAILYCSWQFFIFWNQYYTELKFCIIFFSQSETIPLSTTLYHTREYLLIQIDFMTGGIDLD